MSEKDNSKGRPPVEEESYRNRCIRIAAKRRADMRVKRAIVIRWVRRLEERDFDLFFLAGAEGLWRDIGEREE